MNPLFRTLSALTLAGALLTPAASAVSLTLDGQPLPVEDPIVCENTTYVPLRSALEVLEPSAQIAWAADRAVALFPDFTLTACPGSYTIFQDSTPIPLTAPVLLNAGRTLVPIRPLAALLGLEVTWDSQTSTVSLTSPTPAWREDELYWLSRIISAESRGEPLLELEEVITQHPAVAAIYPGSINTVRMVTIRGKSGKVYLVTAMFRIGNGKFVDNFNSGGMVAPMDPVTGTVIDRALDKQKNLYENHPATGTPIKGFTFPHWDRAVELVTQAAQVIPEVGYVGWDVCFTPDGPCLVEGNQFPGHDIYQLPVHTPDKIGIMPRFRAIGAAEAELEQ